MQGVRRHAGCTVLAAVVATATAGARDAWQASLQSSKRDRPPPRSPIWDKSFRCVVNGKNASTNAYAVVLGPISEERKYSKWVYPILALKAALKKRGSRADVLALLALEEDKEHHRMLPGEEAMLRNAGVRYRRSKPRIRGFHMATTNCGPGSTPSTTEYKCSTLMYTTKTWTRCSTCRSHLPLWLPGQGQRVKRGLVLLRPDCETFKHDGFALVPGHAPARQWDMSKGWGVPIGGNQPVRRCAVSVGAEPTSPRHRAGVASMAWRSRAFSASAP